MRALTAVPVGNAITGSTLLDDETDGTGGTKPVASTTTNSEDRAGRSRHGVVVDACTPTHDDAPDVAPAERPPAFATAEPTARGNGAADVGVVIDVCVVAVVVVDVGCVVVVVAVAPDGRAGDRGGKTTLMRSLSAMRAQGACLSHRIAAVSDKRPMG
jgi:hypothetical protein